MKHIKKFNEEFDYKGKIKDAADSVGSFLKGTVSKKELREDDLYNQKNNNIMRIVKNKLHDEITDRFTFNDMGGIYTDGVDCWSFDQPGKESICIIPNRYNKVMKISFYMHSNPSSTVDINGDNLEHIADEIVENIKMFKNMNKQKSISDPGIFRRIKGENPDPDVYIE